MRSRPPASPPRASRPQRAITPSWPDEAYARALERAYTSGKMPVKRRKRANPRHVMRWIMTVVLGVGAVAFWMNHGVIFGKINQLGIFAGSSRAAFIDNLADDILAKMTLDEKVGQFMIPMAQDHSMNQDLTTMITQDHIGGFFVTDGGMNAAGVRAFTQQIQHTTHIPMILAADFEGDQGFDVLSNALPPQPSEAQVGATGDPHQAYLKGVNDGHALASVGVNVDFGPVVDVLTNPNNPILQGRTFGSTPGYVTTMAGQFLDGLYSTGIPGSLKHFPGLGSSSQDPHHVLPYINRSLAQMEAVDLVPYKQLIAQGKVSLIMTTHMLIPALDPNLPTSISPNVINGLLRQQMGYNGVVVSDALFMGGLSYKYDIPHAGLLAFEAGTDLLLGSYSEWQTRQMMNLIENAVAQGQISPQRIDQSVLRILKFKIQWNIIPSNYQVSNSTARTMLTGPDLALSATADLDRRIG
jgi:beta-N-acetylhexosaminidase